MSQIKVGVIGYGTIGKRVADAILLQEDMELVGITSHSHNYKIKAAIKKGINIVPIEDGASLVKSVDVIVDCTPKGP